MRTSERERRTITIALWVSGVALALAFVVVPFARRVSGRNTQIEIERERVARLTAYIRRQPQIDSAVALREHALQSSPTRVLRGRSPALAAAELQRILQDDARMSRVSVSRLEVSGVADSTPVTQQRMLPATISAVGDIYGLVQLLGYLQHGPQLVDVRDVTILSTSALRGDLLQLSLQVQAPFLVDP